VHGVGSAGGDADQLLVGSGGNSRGRKMTLIDAIDQNIARHTIRDRVALRWLKMRCRRDPDFAASFEEELATLMNVKSIDWSQIDWEQVVKIVLMILAAFGVL
jgi:hypothetical protein